MHYVAGMATEIPRPVRALATVALVLGIVFTVFGAGGFAVLRFFANGSERAGTAAAASDASFIAAAVLVLGIALLLGGIVASAVIRGASRR
jgi:uncharacterized membrane protein HdeD (DUF308 family)